VCAGREENICHTFSPVIANGVLNHCSKVLQDLKMSGSKKFMRAQSSGRLFWEERNTTMQPLSS